MIEHAQVGGPKVSWQIRRPCQTAITRGDGQEMAYSDIGGLDVERQYRPDMTPLRTVVWLYPCEPGYKGMVAGVRVDDATSIVVVEPDGLETRWQVGDGGLLWRQDRAGHQA